MDLLNKLTIKNLKLNKKRTIVTIIGIILSIALLTAVSTVYMSGLKSIEDYEIKITGNYHYLFRDVTKSDIDRMKLNESVEKVSESKLIGYADIKSQNKDKPYAAITALNKDALNTLPIKLKEGRLPENDSEVVIPTHLRTNGRVSLNIGDKITLNVGKRMAGSEELTQNNPYDHEGEELVDTVKKEYTIVGIGGRVSSSIEPYSAPGYTFITYKKEFNENDSVTAYLTIKRDKMKDAYNIFADIEGVDRKDFDRYINGKFSDISTEEAEKIFDRVESNMKYTKFDINQYLIGLQKNPIQGSAMGDLSRVVAIVLIIIVVCSVFCIKNSFDISITEKIKQYGMLRSIGSTKRQIRKNVLYEASILGIIGIPLGVFLGLFASFILMIISNKLLSNSYSEDLVLRFSISWLAILVSIILGMITIYLSALKSAFKASRVSPIESIRNSGNIKIKKRSLKCPKIISKIFKIGGEISFKNMKRNKRKFRTTVVSIVISTSVFIALSYFMGIAIDSVKEEVNASDHNIDVSITNPTDETYKKYLDLKNVTGVEKLSLEYTVYFDVDTDIVKGKVNEEFKKFKGDDYQYYEPYIDVIVLDDESFNDYLNSLGESSKDYDKAGVFVNKVMCYNYSKTTNNKKKIDTFNYKAGDTIKGKVVDLKIGTITETLPFGFVGSEVGTNYMFINKTAEKNIFKKELFKDENIRSTSININIQSSDAIKTQDELENILKGEEFTLSNKDENVREMQNVVLLIGIFLYGFITVITLIGITNIFNTITSNINLRRQEFAMLKSIGMTKKEFNNMIRLESLFIGIKSLLFGIPLGIGLSYIVYKSFNQGIITYSIPVKPIIISSIGVFLLISIIMNYSVNKCKNQNIIETIRNDNI